MQRNKKDSALYYQSLGLSIIPTGNDKKPLINWKEYQERCATREEVINWWKQFPEANPALVTGKISGVVVLDLDKKHNRSSKEFTLPVTICARSGNGGEHFFFKYPLGVHVKSGSAINGEGVDSRADGGYVLLAPSTNAQGGEYQWTVPFDYKEDLAEMPEWFLKLVTENREEKKWLSGKDGVFEGSRHDTAVSMAGKIISSTSPLLLEDIGWESFKVWNSKNKPPLTEKEMRTIWEGVIKQHFKNNPSQKNNTSNEKKKGRAVTRRFSDIKSVSIDWLWAKKIPLGKLTMITGDPGLGKSLVTTGMAATVSMGGAWPLGEYNSRIGDVIFISGEDDPADTIKPRLEAAGADCTRIHIVEAIQEDSENGVTERMFSFERDMKILEDLLSTLPNCRLVIIDPISAYLGNVDSNKNSDVRGLLSPLTRLAEKHKTAIVLVSHLNKNSREDPIYRTSGSLAFIAAVRVAYMVTKDKERPERRLFMPIKSNISKDSGGLAYSIVEAENKNAVIAWESEAVEKTIEEALAPFEQEELTATDEAKMFLLEALSNGPVRVDQINKEAKQIGITQKPLRSARESLGIITKKSSTFKDSFWLLSLPEGALSNEDASSKVEGNLDIQGHLGLGNELEL